MLFGPLLASEGPAAKLEDGLFSRKKEQHIDEERKADHQALDISSLAVGKGELVNGSWSSRER